MNPNAGGFIDGGYFYSVDFSKFWGMTSTRLSRFDIDTWDEDYSYTKGINNATMAATAMVFDPIAKVGYGCFNNYDEDGFEIGVADYVEFTRTTLSTVDIPLVAMAMSTDGIVYAINTDGELFTLDKEEGTLSKIGSTGLSLEAKIQGCVYDPVSSSLILAGVIQDGMSGLYLINIEDATSVLLTDLPYNEYFSFLSLPVEPEADAPAQAMDLILDFPKGSTDGNVTFSIPTTTFSGSELTGEVTYTVIVNGNVESSGIAMPGQHVSVPLSLEEGNAKVAVGLKNAYGESKKISATAYIGFAYPDFINGIKLDFNNSDYSVKLSWQPPLYALSEGYFNPDDIRYDVVRQPDGKVIGEGISETECKDVLPFGEWTGYRYEITAINGTVRAYPSYTEYIALGEPVTLPFYTDFSSDEDFGKFTVLSSREQNAGGGWMFSPYTGGAVFYPESIDGDDWLIAPPMELKGGYIYMLKFTCKADYVYNGSKETVEVGYGHGVHPEEYHVLLEPTDVDWTEYEEFPLLLTPKEDGVYRIGFHALSKANMKGLLIGSVSVEYGVAPGSPAAVENLEVNAGKEGALSADLSFNLPTFNINGDKLEEITGLEVYRDGKLWIDRNEDLVPGEKIDLVDEENLSVGLHEYSVMCYNKDGRGQATVAEVFIGPDAPGQVKNLRFIDNFDGTAYLRWDAPDTVGLNGGYCSPEGISYSVIVENEFGQMLEKVDYAENEVFITGIDMEGRQRLVIGTVVASNSQGEGETTVQYAPLYGAPYTLSFEELLTDGFTTYDCWRSTEMNGRQFGIMMIVGGDMGVDESYFSYNASKSGDSSVLSSGKISLEGAEKPMLSFESYEFPGAEMSLEVFLDLATEKDATLGVIDYRELTGSDREWNLHTFDLSSYTDYPYVTLNFKGVIDVAGETCAIRRVKVVDMAENAVEQIVDPAHLATVVCKQGVILISGAEGLPLDVYTLSGINVFHKVACEHESISVEPGYYVVKIADRAFKVVVK